MFTTLILHTIMSTADIRPLLPRKQRRKRSAAIGEFHSTKFFQLQKYDGEIREGQMQ